MLQTHIRTGSIVLSQQAIQTHNPTRYSRSDIAPTSTDRLTFRRVVVKPPELRGIMYCMQHDRDGIQFSLETWIFLNWSISDAAALFGVGARAKLTDSRVLPETLTKLISAWEYFEIGL